MTKTALACALSVGLHGFLLTQWPLPGGQFPLRPLMEPVQAVYLTAAAAPMAHPRPLVGAPTRRLVSSPLVKTTAPTRASVPVSAARLTDQFFARMTPPAPVATPLLPPAPVRSARPNEEAPTRSDPTPSLLTPADFARFRYKQMVRARLQRAILYPAGHALEGGRARLHLTITREGQVASASCTSVESPVFEESVMAGVTAAGPFPAFPAELSVSQETYEFLVAYTPGAAASVSP